MKALLLPAAFAFVLAAHAEPPLYAQRETPPASFAWLDEIQKHVPPLKNARGDRLPMIMWEAGPFEVQPPEVYKALLARGLTQHIQMDEKMIPIAKALQDAGSPVIMMQGGAERWPSSVGVDPQVWQHDFDEGYQPKGAVLACPVVSAGWEKNADAMRAILQKYKDAGVTVDGVWMDWEGDPVAGADRYEQALHCKRCRATLPESVLANEKAFKDYTWRRYMDLVGAYLAAPVNDIFPACSVTNWHATVSSADRPVMNWYDKPYCPVVPPLLTASNPVAYGNTVSFAFWKPEYPMDREHVDQFYTYLLLQEISNDAANRQVWTSARKSIPWVARWCPDNEDPKIPVMSRERYRETLRHMWLRGVHAMQVFNPKRQGFESLAVAEVEDTSAIYDEMLAYKDFLDHGSPLNCEAPKHQGDDVIWSGLRWENRAVIRAFKPGGGSAPLTVSPWPDAKITLDVPAEGKTWELAFKDGKIQIMN